jgi:hypothetical protein
MPPRPAKVTEGEIGRALRAAKKAGAAEVVIDLEGKIHIVLSPEPSIVAPAPPENKDEVWELSTPPVRKKQWSTRNATSHRDHRRTTDRD